MGLLQLDQTGRLEAYFREIDSGKLRFLNPNPFVNRHFLTKRTLFKVIHLPAHLVHEISRKLGASFICLYRHPIPVALSREVFPLFAEFTAGRYRNHFSVEQCALCDRLLESGSHLEKGVAAWCLHYYLYDKRMRSEFKGEQNVIFYEECVLYPAETIQKMERYLDVRFDCNVLRRAMKPSQVLAKSDGTTQDVLQNTKNSQERSRYLVSRWTERVSKDECIQVQAILDLFGVKVYNAFDPMPQSMVRHD
tara:strand:- start:8261 stop:9010 length:750 start_codon:yes stop_codon:yes gene_type:complete